MGGSAFASGENPLFTPRMPPHIYELVKSRCKSALRELYIYVASPIDGPAKRDYGDVDVLMTCARGEFTGRSGEEALPETVIKAIQYALGAEYVLAERGGSHFAVPWPKDLPADSCAAEQQPQRYIQVDVTVSPSVTSLQWSLFKHAHGDIWSILGSVIRPYGLTVDEQRMFLRIPEIEQTNKNKAKIELTDDPCEILEFLGLPIAGFWETPFPTLNDMYEYVAQCRMFWVRPGKEGANDQGGTHDPAQDKAKLKSNDRKRMSSRPNFSKWIDEFVPRCRQEGRYTTQRTSREQIKHEAFARFHVEAEYNRRLDEYIREKQIDTVWKDIKAAFPAADPTDKYACQSRGCTIKALKKVIIEGDTSFGVLPDEDSPMRDKDGFFIFENVYDFISRKGQEVGRAAMARHHQAYEELLETKGLKRKQETSSEVA
ncbi:hypothetical protein VD0002_g1915 [Verticillium dahliae]|uniref:Uncharacterized protein n=2 Tax=Verticillium dahliae TaxID=27337 RepID=G2WZI4_VERDV|nr:uncharacterized protein VDAG_03426 [Verticillium dahliae VdLs.17]KAF3346651.1 Putative aconitate hydratase 2 [Verticillium dahliae VDG2]KAH6703828.1 hypothetical protein EV126DRAFT_216041 [Verticillium dahliae]EGY21986.1 hypothetical protein VDAG_03426 [Verticillium dahliae VdLs.17]PNH29119.1 hypothetical protein BJF96_g7585 [Verticillium dahliae]PNH43232.1 hypothetical protein VD0004_g4202 [Verticillium dahliae]